MHGLGPGDDPERAEHQRHRPAPAAAQARIRPGREREHGERDEAADEVIARRRARRRLQEAVVEHVQRDRGDAEHEQSGLAPERAREIGETGDGARKASRGGGGHGGSYAAARAAGFATAA